MIDYNEEVEQSIGDIKLIFLKLKLEPTDLLICRVSPADSVSSVSRYIKKLPDILHQSLVDSGLKSRCLVIADTNVDVSKIPDTVLNTMGYFHESDIERLTSDAAQRRAKLIVLKKTLETDE